MKLRCLNHEFGSILTRYTTLHEKGHNNKTKASLEGATSEMEDGDRKQMSIM